MPTGRRSGANSPRLNLHTAGIGHVQAAIVDEAELGQLAKLVARLTPGQQRLVVALADGFRGGWLEPLQWERAWRGTDLEDDGVLGDARTWLVRRQPQWESRNGG